MRNQGQFFLGLFVIVIGVMFLIGNLFDVDVGIFCWPVGLIMLGLFVLLRPRFAGPDAKSTWRLVGEVDRQGAWQVDDEEFWVFVADFDLDFGEADLAYGQTRMQIFGFVGDLNLYVPEDVGVQVRATAFVSEVRLFDEKQESFVAPISVRSDNYELAERKLLIEATLFVAEIVVRRA